MYAHSIPVAIRDSLSSNVGRVWLSATPKSGGGHVGKEEESGDMFRDLVAVDECTSMVDGIGGIVWEGAVLLSQYLRDHLNPSLCGLVIELGCGAGLCGLVAAKMGVRTFLTDREVDLARANAATLSTMHPECGDLVNVCELDWHEPMPEAIMSASTKNCKLILGVEVACLLKQQSALISVLTKLYTPNSLILITFDAGAEPSKYERSFRASMRDQGFLSTTAHSGSVEFSELPRGFRGSAMLGLPPTYPEARRSFCTVLPDIAPANAAPDGVNIDAESCKRHFIEIFYKPSAARTCSRCNKAYFDAFNTSHSCRHHSGYFVCRRHPSETRCSISGHGDGLGYYGNGKEGDNTPINCCIFFSASLHLICSHQDGMRSSGTAAELKMHMHWGAAFLSTSPISLRRMFN
jgi:hypothetical protein